MRRSGPTGSPTDEWLMQPRWLPTLRAALGVAVVLVFFLLGALVLTTVDEREGIALAGRPGPAPTSP